MASFPNFVTSILLLLLVMKKPFSCRAGTGDRGGGSLILGGCGIASIYNFGDSFSDTGNGLAEYPGGPMGNFPNGMTIHRATGRFCDGYLIIDHIAEAAGLPYLNPYLRKNLDHSKGTNFAVGGVGLLSNKTRAKWKVSLPSQDSVDVQLQWLQQHLNHTFKDEQARRDHLKSSLFVLAGGSGNDYGNVHRNSSSPPLELMRKAMIPDVMAAIKAYVKKLIIDYGASKVVVTGLYKAGCTVDGRLFRDRKPHCNTATNALVALHNQALKQELGELRKAFPDAHIVYGDMWGPTEWLLDHYWTLGFKQPTDRFCCGNGSMVCGSPGSPYCHNPGEYMFWDDHHLTDHSYRSIAKVMIPQLANDLGCGAGNGRHGHKEEDHKSSAAAVKSRAVTFGVLVSFLVVKLL